MLSTWSYASTCTASDADPRSTVEAIVAVSRVRNESLDVTGALIWTGGHFAQFLEGPNGAIAALRESITRDPRHHAILTLEYAGASTRIFHGWSLAYSGTASFVEREIKRISAQGSTQNMNSARELRSLLVEFDRGG